MRTKKAVYNMFSNLILQLVIIIYGFVVPKIIISNYGSNVNGLISSINQFLSYIALIEAGFGGIVQYLLYKPIARKNREEIDDILASSQKFFSFVSKVFIIYIIALCFLYPLLVNSTFDKWFTISLILIISINTFSEYYFGLVYKVYLFADQRKYVVSFISIITYILNMAFIILISKFNISVHLLKLVSTLIFTIRPLFQNYYVKKVCGIDIKKGNKNYKIKQKWDALAQHIAAVIHNSTDITILTLFCKISIVSVYSVYSLVVSGIRKIISIFYDSISSGFGDLIARDEQKKLIVVFNYAESLFFTFSTIIFSCTFLLITPFISIYTKNITDVNYIRPVFGYLLVLSEFFWTVRFPYSSITLAAGHYKETRNGAIAECLINLIISIILVKKYGLIGVTIGTSIAMLIRTIEFIIHSCKYILERNIIIPITKIGLMFFETLIIILICRHINLFQYTSYFNWAKNGLLIMLISISIVLPINCLIYKKDFKIIGEKMYKVFLKRRNENI